LAVAIGKVVEHREGDELLDRHPEMRRLLLELVPGKAVEAECQGTLSVDTRATVCMRATVYA
jgi:hypothetical protein